MNAERSGEQIKINHMSIVAIQTTTSHAVSIITSTKLVTDYSEGLHDVINIIFCEHIVTALP